MAETGFSHRLTAYKIVGHFFGLSYLNISGNNQVDFFLRISIILFPPACSAQRSHSHQKVMDIFRTLGRYRCQSPPCWIFRVKQIHQSQSRPRRGLRHGYEWLKSIHQASMSYYLHLYFMRMNMRTAKFYIKSYWAHIEDIKLYSYVLSGK